MTGPAEIRFRRRVRAVTALLDEVLRWRAIKNNHATSRVMRDEAIVAYTRKSDELIEELAQLRDEGAVHRLLRRVRDDD